MADDELTLSGFVVALMERSHARMNQALDGLSDEQLYYQPAEATNPIGWLVWHLSRWKDIQTGRVADEAEVWVTDGWATRFGLLDQDHGNGHTPEQVAAFRADRGLLMGYADAAQNTALRRVREASADLLLRPSTGADGVARPAWARLVTNAIDYMEHTGQIAYLRGMLTGPGWL